PERGGGQGDPGLGGRTERGGQGSLELRRQQRGVAGVPAPVQPPGGGAVAGVGVCEQRDLRLPDVVEVELHAGERAAGVRPGRDGAAAVRADPGGADGVRGSWAACGTRVTATPPPPPPPPSATTTSWRPIPRLPPAPSS